jgi:hypothetical protein
MGNSFCFDLVLFGVICEMEAPVSPIYRMVK